MYLWSWVAGACLPPPAHPALNCIFLRGSPTIQHRERQVFFVAKLGSIGIQRNSKLYFPPKLTNHPTPKVYSSHNCCQYCWHKVSQYRESNACFWYCSYRVSHRPLRRLFLKLLLWDGSVSGGPWFGTGSWAPWQLKVEKRFVSSYSRYILHTTF